MAVSREESMVLYHPPRWQARYNHGYFLICLPNCAPRLCAATEHEVGDELGGVPPL